MRGGFGHVRRCLSLAQALRVIGVESAFRLHGSEQLAMTLEREGFETTLVSHARDGEQTCDQAASRGVSWIVADSYDFDTAYLAALSLRGSRVLTIDDLANQPLPVDAVVNGALGAEQVTYQVAPHTRLLLGSEYALLRKEFSAEPRRPIDRGLRNVLVTVGGSDPHHLSERLVRAASRAGAGSIDAVIGPLFEISPNQLAGAADRSRVDVHRTPQDMRSLMLRADVTLCAGGQTLYELAATATPALAVRTAANQTPNLSAFSAAGITRWVGDVEDPVLDERIVDALSLLFEDTEARAEMGRRGRAAVDGRGAERVATWIDGIGRDRGGGR